MATLADLLRSSSDNSQNDMNSFSPESGQVKLQQFNPQNMSVEKTLDYTIPKDQIQSFNPALDNEGNSTGAGTYILKDGSQMNVGADGIVTGATPGRNEYTLNEQGYYQPTGSGLTWNGNSNTLSKKIGGVDVLVPSLYQKGGYQNAQGGLRLDENGVPIALAPNFADSGVGQSGLSDAAPYIAMATLAAMGMPVGAMAFEGMVPASETLLGGMGASATTGGTYGLTASQVPNLGASLGATGGTVGGTGAGWGGLTATSSGGMGLTAASVPSLTTGLELGASGASTFGAKDVYDAYKTANSLKNMFGKNNVGGNNAAQLSSNGLSNAGTGSNFNYQNQPFLSNPQQKSIYAPTGLDVSGSQANSLDVSRSGNLLANLLRR
jgi:hypothetical protein